MSSFTPQSRRAFLTSTGVGLGSVAVNLLLARELRAKDSPDKYRGLPGFPHHAPKVKRVIYLYMSGGPSHLETFDYKPQLDKLDGAPMPESFTKGQPIAQLQGAKLKVQGHLAKFAVFKVGDSLRESRHSRKRMTIPKRQRRSLILAAKKMASRIRETRHSRSE